MSQFLLVDGVNGPGPTKQLSQNHEIFLSPSLARPPALYSCRRIYVRRECEVSTAFGFCRQLGDVSLVPGPNDQPDRHHSSASGDCSRFAAPGGMEGAHGGVWRFAFVHRLLLGVGASGLSRNTDRLWMFWLCGSMVPDHAFLVGARLVSVSGFSSVVLAVLRPGQYQGTINLRGLRAVVECSLRRRQPGRRKPLTSVGPSSYYPSAAKTL